MVFLIIPNAILILNDETKYLSGIFRLKLDFVFIFRKFQL